eukprot:2019128-Pyramimonas_sp.AAC.1
MHEKEGEEKKDEEEGGTRGTALCKRGPNNTRFWETIVSFSCCSPRTGAPVRVGDDDERAECDE